MPDRAVCHVNYRQFGHMRVRTKVPGTSSLESSVTSGRAGLPCQQRCGTRLSTEEDKNAGHHRRSGRFWSFPPGSDPGHQGSGGSSRAAHRDHGAPGRGGLRRRPRRLPGGPARDRTGREAAQAETDKALAEVGEPRPESVNVTAVHGFPAEVLIEASRDADMVVLGSRGVGGFGHLIMGSVTSQVAHHAACPVLIVPPERRG